MEKELLFLGHKLFSSDSFFLLLKLSKGCFDFFTIASHRQLSYIWTITFWALSIYSNLKGFEKLLFSICYVLYIVVSTLIFGLRFYVVKENIPTSLTLIIAHRIVKAKIRVLILELSRIKIRFSQLRITLSTRYKLCKI